MASPSPASPANLLDALAERRQGTSAFWLLHQIHQALQSQQAGGQPLEPAWQGWWDLLRFCLGTQSIALWLQGERAVLQRIHALATLAGADGLAGIVGDALQGQAQPAATVTFSQLGAADLHFTLQGPAQERFDGQDWTGTDAAIEAHMDGFAHTVAELILGERDKLHLPLPEPPPTTPPAPAALPALRAIGARHPQLQVRHIERGSHGLLPVQHHWQPPLDADLHEFYTTLWDEPLATLLQAYAPHNGARLFCHGGTVGLTLHPIEQWDTLHAQMLDWARAHTWHDAPAGPPDWLHGATCFAQNGMTHEFWMLVTQGELAGSVLLSETDALWERPRFGSVHAFLDTLQHAPGRILGASGGLLYTAGGQTFEAI